MNVKNLYGHKMQKDITAIANRMIPKPKSVDLIQREYITTDIIKQVLSHFEKHKNQLKAFAPYLKGATVKDTCYNIWKFWYSHIKYIADDAGAWKQLVKSPAAVWEDKFCDCKSFSVAVAVCCYQLGIKCAFRFVSFNPDAKTIPTHVYNVAYDEAGREIKIDCCLPAFDMEKNYAAKYDYLPQGLYAVNGVGKPGRRILFPHKQRGCLCLKDAKTQAELELLIKKQQLELEQMKAAKVHGIGSLADNAYEIELTAVNNAIAEIANPYLARHFKTRFLKPATEFIGMPEDREFIAGKKKKEKAAPKPNKKTAKKAKKEEKKTAKAVKRNEAGKGINKKDAKRLQKVNIVVKKKKEGILKKVAKVVTAPLRLIAKGVLEVALPKSAPAFLYLFLDEKIVAKSPTIVQAKRNKAVKIADNIVNKIGMKREHLMGILRNGIMNHLGDTPENIISKWIKDANYQIGLLPAFAAAGKFLFDVVKKVGAGKVEDLNAAAPDPTDWITESSEVRNDIANEVRDNQPPVYQQPDNEQAIYNSPAYPSPSYNENYTKEPYKESEYGSGSFGQGNYAGKDLENVTLTNKKPADSTEDEGEGTEPEPTGKDNSGMLVLGALALAAVAFSGKGRKK